ncbi:MAG: hypothetical protein KDK78_04300, partial [Chlamydiia bacterium]|nr:hypothetical protein [Chlamydiia bacterium]
GGQHANPHKDAILTSTTLSKFLLGCANFTDEESECLLKGLRQASTEDDWSETKDNLLKHAAYFGAAGMEKMLHDLIQKI